MKLICIFLTAALTFSHYGEVLSLSNETAVRGVDLTQILIHSNKANSFSSDGEKNERSEGAVTITSSPVAKETESLLVPAVVPELRPVSSKIQPEGDHVEIAFDNVVTTSLYDEPSKDTDGAQDLFPKGVGETENRTLAPSQEMTDYDTQTGFVNPGNQPEFGNATADFDWLTDFKNGGRCPPLSFPCGDGTCLPFSFFCDSDPQCPDGSDEDEAYCRQGVPAVICADGLQMLKGHDARCDGTEDCYDGSDELGCFSVTNQTDGGNQTTFLKPCSWEYQFQCSEGTCIDKSQVCDGEYDCPLGVDESLAQCALKKAMDNLNGFNPNPYQYSQNDLRLQKAFLCTSGDIVIASGDINCDGHDDCLDGSDEQNCGRDYLCADGQNVFSMTDIRCDGVLQCHDQSDETSCSYNQEGSLYVTSPSDKEKLRTYPIIMITLAVTLLVFLIIIIIQMRLICGLRATTLKQEKKRAIVMTHPTRPPSYSQVIAGSGINPSS